MKRFRARLSEDGAGYRTAAAQFRELGIVFWLAVTLLEHAEWLLAHDRADEAAPLLAEAREIFERLAATPWLVRIATLVSTHTAAAPVAVPSQ